jgi:RNA polymerase sigma-54 factor
MSARPHLNVTTTQRITLNLGLVAAINTLRADAAGLTRYLEEAAAANPALQLRHTEPLSGEWLPRWSAAFAQSQGADATAAAAPPSLIAHVMAYASARIASRNDRAIALVFAEALEPTGWLGRPLAAIATEARCSVTQARAVLALLQQIEPRGLFAQSLAECLALQAQEIGAMDATMTVILDHLDLLAQGALARLAHLAKVPEAEIARRLRLIRGLDPKPGAAFHQGAAPLREPDLIATKGGDGWQIALNHSALPSLSLAPGAAGKSRSAARGIIALVTARNDSLLRMAGAVLQYQKDALDHGLGALKPLRMADLAAQLGLHESTVSRLVAGTAVDTPRGTWWLRHLFSRDMGDGISAVALRERMAGLIADEDPAHPLSDEVLAAALSDRGMVVARRTVAKYRQVLRIPAAHARRATRRRKWVPLA